MISPKKTIYNQKGEAATVLTIMGLAVMLIGTIVGTQIQKGQTFKQQTKALSVFCVDTDQGLGSPAYFYKAGYVQYTKGETYTFKDICDKDMYGTPSDSKIIHEQICNTSSEPDEITYSCSNGCNEGACILKPTVYNVKASPIPVPTSLPTSTLAPSIMPTSTLAPTQSPYGRVNITVRTNMGKYDGCGEKITLTLRTQEREVKTYNIPDKDESMIIDNDSRYAREFTDLDPNHYDLIAGIFVKSPSDSWKLVGRADTDYFLVSANETVDKTLAITPSDEASQYCHGKITLYSKVNYNDNYPIKDIRYDIHSRLSKYINNPMSGNVYSVSYYNLSFNQNHVSTVFPYKDIPVPRYLIKSMDVDCGTSGYYDEYKGCVFQLSDEKQSASGYWTFNVASPSQARAGVTTSFDENDPIESYEIELGERLPENDLMVIAQRKYIYNPESRTHYIVNFTDRVVESNHYSLSARYKKQDGEEDYLDLATPLERGCSGSITEGTWCEFSSPGWAEFEKSFCHGANEGCTGSPNQGDCCNSLTCTALPDGNFCQQNPPTPTNRPTNPTPTQRPSCLGNFAACGIGNPPCCSPYVCRSAQGESVSRCQRSLPEQPSPTTPPSCAHSGDYCGSFGGQTYPNCCSGENLACEWVPGNEKRCQQHTPTSTPTIPPQIPEGGISGVQSADINNDGVVSVADWLMALQNYGNDISTTTTVDARMMSLIRSNFGKTTTPTTTPQPSSTAPVWEKLRVTDKKDVSRTQEQTQQGNIESIYWPNRDSITVTNTAFEEGELYQQVIDRLPKDVSIDFALLTAYVNTTSLNGNPLQRVSKPLVTAEEVLVPTMDDLSGKNAQNDAVKQSNKLSKRASKYLRKRKLNVSNRKGRNILERLLSSDRFLVWTDALSIQSITGFHTNSANQDETSLVIGTQGMWIINISQDTDTIKEYAIMAARLDPNGDRISDHLIPLYVGTDTRTPFWAEIKGNGRNEALVVVEVYDSTKDKFEFDAAIVDDHGNLISKGWKTIDDETRDWYSRPDIKYDPQNDQYVVTYYKLSGNGLGEFNQRALAFRTIKSLGNEGIDLSNEIIVQTGDLIAHDPTVLVDKDSNVNFIWAEVVVHYEQTALKFAKYNTQGQVLIEPQIITESPYYYDLLNLRSLGENWYVITGSRFPAFQDSKPFIVTWSPDFGSMKNVTHDILNTELEQFSIVQTPVQDGEYNFLLFAIDEPQGYDWYKTGLVSATMTTLPD